MFTVTTEWINANRTKKGSFTSAQFKALGIHSLEDKKSGWARRMHGKQITQAAADAFVQGKHQFKGAKRQRAAMDACAGPVPTDATRPAPGAATGQPITRRWIAEQLGELAAQADNDLRAKILALQAVLLAA